MDFDDKDYASTDEAINNLVLAKLGLKQLGFKKFMTIRTGKGYQLFVFDFNEWAKKGLKAVMPRDREYAYLNKMRLLTSKLKDMKIKWDYDVSCDTRRICRVPNTYHNNGNLIRVIGYD
jgi:hypothetical protein